MDVTSLRVHWMIFSFRHVSESQSENVEPIEEVQKAASEDEKSEIEETYNFESIENVGFKEKQDDYEKVKDESSEGQPQPSNMATTKVIAILAQLKVSYGEEPDSNMKEPYTERKVEEKGTKEDVEKEDQSSFEEKKEQKEETKNEESKEEEDPFCRKVDMGKGIQ